MNFKKIWICFISIFFLNCFLAPVSYSQFKKFRSKSKFTKTDGGGEFRSAKSFLKKAQVRKTTDGFGRSTESSATPPHQRGSKYVNLNPETAFGPEVITSFDYPNITLIELTKRMQELTGINLILNKDLKGKISIMAPSPITVGDAWKAFLTALNLNSYTLVKSGAFYKIVNARDIRYTPTKIYTGNYTPHTENYVMRIIPLKNINSTEVTRSFRPFMSRYGRIIDIKQTNTIIVQDTGSNINRLIRLIKFIDVPGHEETLQIIPVKYSSAQEIAKLLDKILKSKGSGKFRSSSRKKTQGQNISKIIAEQRTNSIIAMANAAGAMQLRNLIKKLDVKGVALNVGRIHVYYLNYGDAESLAKTLSSLVGGTGTRKKGSRFSKNSSTNVDSLFSGPVKITADKDNNAIVVTASPTDYLTIKRVIGKLDIPREQVFVEGMIMETAVNNGSSYGINFVGAYGKGSNYGGSLGAGGGADLVNLLTKNITSLGGLFAGVGVGKTVTQNIGGQEIEINTLTGLISAIATHSSTNIMSTPQILVLDNVEAIFEVAENVPVAERSTTNSTSTVSIKQQKVGLTLKITPQINKVTRFIKLKIDQQIDDFSDRILPTNVANEGVATTSRKAVTTVVVRDRDTIAMGGLMRDKTTETVSKVPLLGDIPILGWLFRNTKKKREKVNLLFFLTPRILAPYDNTVAKTLKDVLNRRSAHLQSALGEDDEYASTVKGLYQKAKKQEEGPLYDVEGASRYRQHNESSRVRNSGGAEDQNIEIEIEEDSEGKLSAPVQANNVVEMPNYQAIYQQVAKRESARNK